jgi:hypothetical protein
MSTEHKSEAAQADLIENTSTSSADVLNSDEQIIRNLEISGEDVGLTWRSIMAAAVSSQILPQRTST